MADSLKTKKPSFESPDAEAAYQRYVEMAETEGGEKAIAELFEKASEFDGHSGLSTDEAGAIKKLLINASFQKCGVVASSMSKYMPRACDTNTFSDEEIASAGAQLEEAAGEVFLNSCAAGGVCTNKVLAKNANPIKGDVNELEKIRALKEDGYDPVALKNDPKGMRNALYEISQKYGDATAVLFGSIVAEGITSWDAIEKNAKQTDDLYNIINDHVEKNLPPDKKDDKLFLAELITQKLRSPFDSAEIEDAKDVIRYVDYGDSWKLSYVLNGYSKLMENGEFKKANGDDDNVGNCLGLAQIDCLILAKFGFDVIEISSPIHSNLAISVDGKFYEYEPVEKKGWKESDAAPETSAKKGLTPSEKLPYGASVGYLGVVADAFYNMACDACSSDKDDAIKLFKMSIALNMRKPDLMKKLADILLYKGAVNKVDGDDKKSKAHYEEAHTLYGQAIAVMTDPKYSGHDKMELGPMEKELLAGIYFQRSKVRNRLGMYGDSWDDLNASLKVYKIDAVLVARAKKFEEISGMYAKNGDEGKNKEYLKKAAGDYFTASIGGNEKNIVEATKLHIKAGDGFMAEWVLNYYRKKFPKLVYSSGNHKLMKALVNSDEAAVEQLKYDIAVVMEKGSWLDAAKGYSKLSEKIKPGEAGTIAEIYFGEANVYKLYATDLKKDASSEYYLKLGVERANKSLDLSKKALAQAKSKKDKKGIEHYNQLCSNIWDLLSILYEKLGEKDQAEFAMEQILKFNQES